MDSLDEFINKIRFSETGEEIFGIGTPEYFKAGMDMYKGFLKTQLPDFSLAEILKIIEHFHEIQQAFDWMGSYNYLRALAIAGRNTAEDAPRNEKPFVGDVCEGATIWVKDVTAEHVTFVYTEKEGEDIRLTIQDFMRIYTPLFNARKNPTK